jgi:hypothetical protein
MDFVQQLKGVIESHLEYKQYFGELANRKFVTVCFIHSCTIDNNISMLKYLLNKIISSNLIDKLDLIAINNIGDNIRISNLDLSDDYVKKLHLINYSTNPLFFEIPTINLIHSFSQFNPNVKVLYLHNKGSSYKELSPVISDWIDLLIYFTQIK